ncbi:hypothetical protein [Kitasatospora purpeofusca]|uniref:hypothetical protein n=1 Tax=Kitasatospora purpeofusca TaxID=67352 RepID=UPI00380084B4
MRALAGLAAGRRPGALSARAPCRRRPGLAPAERRPGAATQFTAERLDADGIVELLDSRLLTEAEPTTGERGWKALPDAFGGLLEPVS